MFIEYHSDEDYEKALSSQIEKMIELNKQALETNWLTAQRSKKWFDRKFVCKNVTNFRVGDLVLMNIKNCFKNLKPGQVQWIGPCRISLEWAGGLFDIVYEENNRSQTYYRVHPEFLKIYVGQVS